VVHPDDQALHVAEGCVHHYINAAKSRKHDTFIQQVRAPPQPSRLPAADVAREGQGGS
jgi:hypothetical protein